MALVLLGVCSCKKSKEAEYDSFANKATATLQSGVTNWLLKGGTNMEMNSQVTGMVNAVSEGIKSEVSRELAIETAEAGQFLLRLHDNDRLPGVLKDEHGQIDSEVVPVMASNRLVGVAYPMERTFHIVKVGYTSTNNYVVVKDSKNAEWKLQRAWETDSKGETFQEWPVK